jgi:hypothetical protein
MYRVLSRSVLLLAILLAAAPASRGQSPSDTPSTGSHREAGGIVWLDSLERGLEAAGRLGRPVAVLVTAPGWCEPCDRFEARVLSDTGVSDLLREEFVAVRLTDRNPAHSRLSFPGYPSILVFHPSGRKLDALRAPDSARALRDALEPYRGPYDSEAAATESRSRAAYRHPGGAFVPQADGTWLHETDEATTVFTRYRSDERYIYLQSDTGAEFIALPRDDGRAFRWDGEAEAWEAAWEVQSP